MERIKFKAEWCEAAKRLKVHHEDMISFLGIEQKKFANIYYGLIYIPDDLITRVNEMLSSLLQIDIESVESWIICKICGRKFEPWGADKDMPNQVPICCDCYNQRQAIDARKRKLFLLNEGLR